MYRVLAFLLPYLAVKVGFNDRSCVDEAGESKRSIYVYDTGALHMSRKNCVL